jgi:hypothetical protein
MFQVVLVGGPTAMTTAGRRHRPQADFAQMLLTGRS